MGQTFRVMICDDQTLIRKSLVIVLERHPDLQVVGEAENGREAVRLAAELRPDLILMDMRMPEMDGVTATQQIHAAFPDIQIVALTTFEEDELITGCLTAGAVGYLLKDLTPEELLKAIELIRGGESILPTSYIRKLARQMQPRGSETSGRDDNRSDNKGESIPAPFTERELEVLQYLLEGYSNKEIAAKLYVSETTVKNHLSSMFSKMEVRDRTQAVLYAVQHGLVRRP